MDIYLRSEVGLDGEESNVQEWKGDWNWKRNKPRWEINNL
jgi:hypothetical protein